MRACFVVILVLGGFGACVGDSGTAEAWRAQIGDEATCDAAEDGCWPETDRAHLAAALHSVDDASRGELTERTEALCDAARALADLDHKLTTDERTTRRAAADDLCDGPAPSEEILGEHATALRSGAMARLEADMVQAYMAPLHLAIDRLVDDPACADAAVACAAGGQPLVVAIPSRWPAGVQDAVSQVAGAGLLGQALATLLVTSGVLDIDYEAANAHLDATTSVEARVDRIVGEAKNSSTWAGAITGAETLIPFAGIAISIGHEEWWMMTIHVKMMLRIAQVYGWDLTDGPTLMAALSIVMQDGLLPDGTDVVVPSVTAPILMRQANTRFGVWTAGRITSFLTLRASRWIIGMLRRRAAERLTSQVVRAGAKSVAQQVLGWLTGGAGIVIGAVGDRLLTTVLGRRAAQSGKRWLGDLALEGSPFVGDPAARACAFETWAAMATADGSLSEIEMRLIEALVARPIWTDERHSFVASFDEQVRRAEALRAIAAGSRAAAVGCVAQGFGRQPGRERRTLLAATFALAAIDGREDAAERNLQNDLRGRLEGGLLSPLDVSLVDQIERTIRAEVALPDSEMGRDAGLTIDDVVPALHVPDETIAAFAR